MSIKISEKTKNNQWVYLVKSPAGEIVYIGVARLKDAITFNAFNFRPEFDPDAPYELELLESYSNRYEANKAKEMYLMVYGTPVFNRECKRVVRCITTGEVFNTAVEACRKYGIEQSNMTHHMAGHLGFKSLKGLEFKYEVLSESKVRE
jgi:hypothetical protein